MPPAACHGKPLTRRPPNEDIDAAVERRQLLAVVAQKCGNVQRLFRQPSRPRVLELRLLRQQIGLECCKSEAVVLYREPPGQASLHQSKRKSPASGESVNKGKWFRHYAFLSQLSDCAISIGDAPDASSPQAINDGRPQRAVTSNTHSALVIQRRLTGSHNGGGGGGRLLSGLAWLIWLLGAGRPASA